MLVTVQFPIADARSFHHDPDLRLPVPDWPNPTTDIRPQFVHFFGRAVERRREPDEAWPDELKFCKAARAIRFDNLARVPVGVQDHLFYPQCAFRRLFCDGQAVVRVEVGFCPRATRNWLPPFDAATLLSILSELCELRANVAVSGASLETNYLLRQGRALSTLYTRARLGTVFNAKVNLAAELVEAGNPLILCEIRGWYDLHEPLPGFQVIRRIRCAAQTLRLDDCRHLSV